jgi:hypothetical protein
LRLLQSRVKIAGLFHVRRTQRSVISTFPPAMKILLSAPLLAGVAAASSSSRRQLAADGRCFTFQSPLESVEEMEAVCQKLGGHVAYSTDTDTLAQLSTFAFEQAADASLYSWVIGLNAQKGCTFSALDGSAVKYTNWSTGEPSGCDSCTGAFYSKGDAECCVEVHKDGACGRGRQAGAVIVVTRAPLLRAFGPRLVLRRVVVVLLLLR